MNAPILSSLKINLPTAPASSRLRAVRAARLSRQGQGRVQPRRLLGRARGRRCARRQRSLADCAVDWDTTIAYREYLWDLGLGVAEAMDTAQRGMGLDWPTSLELIRRAVKAGKAWEARNGRPALIASGCGTDHLDPAERALHRRGDPRLRGADGGDREAPAAA